MTAPEDYDYYDSIEYTQEDLATIDAIAAAYFDPPLPQGCPEVRIELEGPLQPHESTPSTSRDSSEPSPIQTYRRNRVLTVTDLVSPMWCEVQFDYGLRQGRSRPLEARPKSFVSASGKEISVEKKVAAVNDTVTKKGQAVHKELELELGLKQVQVVTTSQEERWALRMLNFITGIEAIPVNGYTRELPVFGVVHDQIIVGVIDEVKYHIYSNSNADLVGVPSDNASQTHLDDYHICRAGLKKKCNNRINYVLQLLDTKTRRTDSLPSPEDTLPSRLQLMLYYRMLSDLVSESSPFDFSSLWDKLCLDSGRIFSAQFLVHAGLVTDCQQERTACLDDLVHLLRRAVEKLDLVGVNQHLQLVYRLQPSRAKKKRNEYRQNDVTPFISQEERELSLAIEASLKDLEVRQDPGESSHQNNSPVDVAQPAVNADSSSDNGNATPPSINGNTNGNATPPSINGNTNGKATPPSINGNISGKATPPSINGKATSSPQDTSNHCADNENGDNSDTECSKIIGTREFYYDETFLNSHVSDILKWWHGKRKPNGVPIHLSGRCFSCEYNKDCEWREEKAMEFTRSFAQRKSTPSTPPVE